MCCTVGQQLCYLPLYCERFRTYNVMAPATPGTGCKILIEDSAPPTAERQRCCRSRHCRLATRQSCHLVRADVPEHSPRHLTAFSPPCHSASVQLGNTACKVHTHSKTLQAPGVLSEACLGGLNKADSHEDVVLSAKKVGRPWMQARLIYTVAWG